MKILIYSDLHFSDPHAEQATAACLRLAEAIREHRPTAVVNCGDTFHTKDAITTTTLHTAAEALRPVCEAIRDVGASHYVISGNHDLGDLAGECTAASLFRFTREDDVHYCPSGTVLALGNDDTKVGFFGYITDRKLREERIQAIRAAECDIVFVHAPLRGAAFNPWGKIDESDDSLDPSVFGAPLVIAGHYHHPQRIVTGSTTVIVVGSPCYYTWGDGISMDNGVPLPRGFGLLERDRRGEFSFDSIENSSAIVRHTIREDKSKHVPVAVADLRGILQVVPAERLRVRIVGEAANELALAIQRDIIPTYPSLTLTLTSQSIDPVLPAVQEVEYTPVDIDSGALLKRALFELEVEDRDAVCALATDIWKEVASAPRSA